MTAQAQIKIVPFHGQTLSVIPQQDKLYVAIKPICENIGIQWRAQRKRILRDTVLSEGVSIMDTPSKGGYQETTCLPLELLNGWLFGVDESRIKNPEVKARVIEYKKECYQVLFDYWTKGEAVNSRSQRSDVSDRKYGYYQERENRFADQGIYLSHDQAQTLYLLLHEVDWVNYRWNQGIGKGVAAINRTLYGSTCEHVDNMARAGRLLDKQLPCIKHKFNHLSAIRPR